MSTKNKNKMHYYIRISDYFIHTYETRYALAQGSEKPLSEVRVTSLCKGNVGDTLVERTFQDGLQETVWSNFNSDCIKWDVL
jgi:hypothetical protein